MGYHNYLSLAKRKAQGVEEQTLKFPDAIINSSLLAIAYALMAVAEAIASITFPRELWIRSYGLGGFGRKQVFNEQPEPSININLGKISKRMANEIGEAIGRGIAEGMKK